jgi:hypothetical protein
MPHPITVAVHAPVTGPDASRGMARIVISRRVGSVDEEVR